MLYLVEIKMPYGRIKSFKVGYTNSNIDKRMVQYKTHNPYCEWLATTEGDRELESRYHNLMNNCELFSRVGKTEWFEVTDRYVAATLENHGFAFLDELLEPSEDEAEEEGE